MACLCGYEDPPGLEIQPWSYFYIWYVVLNRRGDIEWNVQTFVTIYQHELRTLSQLQSGYVRQCHVVRFRPITLRVTTQCTNVNTKLASIGLSEEQSYISLVIVIHRIYPQYLPSLCRSIAPTSRFRTAAMPYWAHHRAAFRCRRHRDVGGRHRWRRLGPWSPRRARRAAGRRTAASRCTTASGIDLCLTGSSSSRRSSPADGAATETWIDLEGRERSVSPSVWMRSSVDTVFRRRWRRQRQRTGVVGHRSAWYTRVGRGDRNGYDRSIDRAGFWSSTRNSSAQNSKRHTTYSLHHNHWAV